MNENFCLLDGSELVEGKPQLKFTKMCANCRFAKLNENNDLVCENEENQRKASEKLLQSVPAGYEITELKLKPLPLKTAVKKCKAWEVNEEKVVEYIKSNIEWV